MHPKDKVVTAIPLQELLDESSSLPLSRGRALGKNEIKDLLRQPGLRFVCAVGGRPLKWIPESENFKFWKDELIQHLVEPDQWKKGARLEDFPDEYLYAASEWTGAPYPVILLEMHH